MKQLLLRMITAEFFWISHTDLVVLMKRSEQNFESFWTETSWWLDSNVWKDDDFGEIDEHWVDVFFTNFDTISDALDMRYRFFGELTVSKIVTYQNFCFDVAVEISSFSESKKRWIDAFSVDSNMYSNVKDERLEHFDEMTDSKIDADSNIWLNVANFRTRIFWSSDSSVENEIHEAKKHWIESFFIDCKALLTVAIVRIELVDEIIASTVISDFNMCFRDVAKKASDFCRAGESSRRMTADFSTTVHVDLTVLIMRFELLIDFFAYWLRTWLRSLSLKLKLFSHRMQIIFERLVSFANETSAKSTRRISIHSFKDVDFMMLCLAYQISNVKFHRHVSNNVNKFDFRYWCWHCWRCCKNFSDSLNRRFSHVKIESKISISWNVDVDFAASSVFNAFDLTRLAFLTALNLVFLTIFRAFASCCSTISLVYSSRNCKTNSYACWFWASHEEYWKRCEFQVS